VKLLSGGCRLYESIDGEAGSRGSWRWRTVVSRASGAKLVTQTVSDYGRGTSPAVTNPKSEEVLYVVRGSGYCRMDGHDHPIRTGTGAYVPPGVAYQIENRSDETIRIVSACCPEDPGRIIRDAIATEAGTGTADRPPVRRTVHESERDGQPATSGRTFRYLVHTDLGCREVTQFVGRIPKSKAPLHHHTYEECIYILEGSGILHLEGQPDASRFSAGTSIYLPVGVVHCLENPGPSDIQVLGVFHPSGSPGVAYERK